MLITELKAKDTILSLSKGKLFVLNCHGCKEIHFPEKDAEELMKTLSDMERLAGVHTTEYICNKENLELQLKLYEREISDADAVLVLSCGVGVQTVAELLPEEKVYAACDTYALPGFQGVTPLTHDCKQCGQCYLNITGGICPITACSKSLVNGQCGGAKNGMCEVDPSMECGWERIQRRLAQVGRLDALKAPVQIHNYNPDVDAQ